MRFYSITLNGYKFQKEGEPVYSGLYAIYKGPFESVSNDDGQIYKAGHPVEISTETAEKLGRTPYNSLFTIIDPVIEPEEPALQTSDKCCTPR